jgi:phosphoglycolate phosphatase
MKRAWDAYDVYLFDIDGTLLECKDAVHYFAFCAVLETLAGRPLTLEGVVAHGNTDIGILRDALRLADVPDAMWRQQLPAIIEDLCGRVAAHKSEMDVIALPGVTAVLKHLRDRGALLGVATGNLQAIGKLKLEQCGLLPYFAFGGFSDEHEHRRDVFRGALQMAAEIAGPSAAVCVVGDTPADIQAARWNGIDVIAVATGVYTFETLAAERPDLCLRSLADLPLANTLSTTASNSAAR